MEIIIFLIGLPIFFFKSALNIILNPSLEDSLGKPDAELIFANHACDAQVLSQLQPQLYDRPLLATLLAQYMRTNTGGLPSELDVWRGVLDMMVDEIAKACGIDAGRLRHSLRELCFRKLAEAERVIKKSDMIVFINTWVGKLEMMEFCDTIG